MSEGAGPAFIADITLPPMPPLPAIPQNRKKFVPPHRDADGRHGAPLCESSTVPRRSRHDARSCPPCHRADGPDARKS